MGYVYTTTLEVKNIVFNGSDLTISIYNEIMLFFLGREFAVMLFNSEVNKNIKTINDRVSSADCEEDLVAILDDLIEGDLLIKHNNVPVVLLLAVSCLLSIVGLSNYMLNEGSQWFAIVGLCASLFLGFLLLHRRSSIDGLSQKIFSRDVLLNNGLTPEKIHGVSLAKLYGSDFFEFHRGNHTQEIEYKATGQFHGDEYAFGYLLMTFHYVDMITTVVPVSNGKDGITMTTETNFHHYRRYGVLFDFPYIDAVQVSESLPGKIHESEYDTASISFSKAYRVQCQDESQAAKFLKPDIVETFTELAKRFDGVSFEAEEGRAVLFVDNDLLELDRQYGIDEPEQFKEEILHYNKSHALDDVLQFAHYLMTQFDNNFRKGK